MSHTYLPDLVQEISERRSSHFNPHLISMRFDYILAELVLHHNQFKLVTDELLESHNSYYINEAIYSVTFPVKFKLRDCNTDTVPE